MSPKKKEVLQPNPRWYHRVTSLEARAGISSLCPWPACLLCVPGNDAHDCGGKTSSRSLGKTHKE